MVIAYEVLAARPVASSIRLAVQPQRGGHILGMRGFPDLIHRPDAQRLKPLVIKLPAVIVPHGTILPDHKI
jgi:hypothetical protein